MRYEFKTMDDEKFVLDTVNMSWGRASSIVSSPSVGAAENGLAQFEYLEQGDLVPMGAGHYSLDGRTPRTTGPGAGLSAVGILSVPFEDKLIMWLVPNAEVEEDSFKSGFPEEAQKFIVYHVRNPQPSVNGPDVFQQPAPASATESDSQ